MEVDSILHPPPQQISYSDDDDDNDDDNMNELDEDEEDIAGDGQAVPRPDGDDDDGDEDDEEEGIEEQAAPKAKVKRVIKSRQSLAEKQPGTTIFPISRVKRIIKADKEVDVMSTEATFLIAAATEYFIKHFMEEGYTKARLDKRKIVNYRDMASVCQRSDEFSFLQDVIPMPMHISEALEKRKQKRLQEEDPTMHDESLAPSADPSETLPPLAASKNPLFPNAVIKRPSNSHAKGASNKSAAKDIASEMTDDEDDQLLIGNTKSTKNGASSSSAAAAHGHGTRKARKSISTVEAIEPIDSDEDEGGDGGDAGSPIEID